MGAIFGLIFNRQLPVYPPVNPLIRPNIVLNTASIAGVSAESYGFGKVVMHESAGRPHVRGSRSDEGMKLSRILVPVAYIKRDLPWRLAWPLFVHVVEQR
jgi:hypothetical protein